MIRTEAPEWQLVLADLALILFLVTLSSLALQSEQSGDGFDSGISTAQAQNVLIAPSQELFRPNVLGPSLTEWLDDHPRDSRITLTVFAQHSGIDRNEIWTAAQSLAAEASESGFEVRVVITRGAERDLHASLAYDI